MIKPESVPSSTAPQVGSNSSSTSPVQVKPFIVLVIVAGVLFFITEAVLAHTAPLEKLFATTEWSTLGAIHGTLGSILFISGGISLYLGYRLLRGRAEASGDLIIASLVTAGAALVTIIFGNWVYIGYRATGMVQDYFLQNMPELHLIFFEFKENIALFTVPLAVAASYILIRYRDELQERLWIRTLIFMLLALVFLFFLFAFGLGAAITKVKPL